MRNTTILCCSATLWAKIIASIQLAFSIPILLTTVYFISKLASGEVEVGPAVAIVAQVLVSIGHAVAAVILFKGIELRLWKYVAIWITTTVLLWLLAFLAFFILWCNFGDTSTSWREFYFLYALPVAMCAAFTVWVAMTVVKDFQGGFPSVRFDFRTLKEEENDFISPA